MSAGVGIKCDPPTVLTGPVNLSVLETPWPGEGTGNNKKYGLLRNMASNAPLTINPLNWMTMTVLQNPVETDAFLTRRIAELISIGEIPSQPDSSFLDSINSPTDSEIKLSDRERSMISFQTRFKNEFCYYNNKYIQAITNFLTLYTNGDNGASAAKTTALTLNCKVNTLIAFMNKLSNINKNKLTELSSGNNAPLNIFNKSIQDTHVELNKQARALSDNNNNSEIFKEMVEYTAEKNRANQNMLSLYFTLNVVAIASLFIIARSL